MINQFEPNFQVPYSSTTPDTFLQSGNEAPSDTFVVCRNRDGSPASLFGDEVWNLTAYHHTEEPSKLDFRFWKEGGINPFRHSIMKESHKILFLLMWMRKGPSLSVGSLCNYLVIVNKLARYSDLNKFGLFEVIGNQKKLLKFVDSLSTIFSLQVLGSMLPHLTHNLFDFPVVGNGLIQAIKTRGVQLRKDNDHQHPSIPTQIYSTIINELVDVRSQWDEVANEMCSFAKLCSENPLMGRGKTGQARSSRRLGISCEGAPEFHELAPPSCMRYLSSRGLQNQVKGLTAAISEIQLAAKLIIQVFTGMREDEAFSLPYDCLEITNINGSEHYIVIGHTTKLNNGRKKPARWITNREGLLAIQSIQKIAETIYSTFDIDIQILKSGYYPLFVSPAYLGLGCKPVVPKDGRFRPVKISLCRMAKLRSALEPIIQESDILELERIDPHRDWRSEETYRPGNKWYFTSHQLRRSLALYAQRSGLVSLPSLRRQLQHITNEMSLYYSKGSIYAKNLIGNDKSHFGKMWQDTKSESEGLSYILNVILSEDILYGGHAMWIKNKVNCSDGMISFDRKETLDQFKRGEIAYQETLLGGCTNTTSCKQSALKWINTECIESGCRHLVCSVPKLDKVIAAQTNLVNSIDVNLLEHRTEKADLDILILAREKAIKANQK